MWKRSAYLVLIALIASLASCSAVEEKEKERAAITAALQKYLSERSGLNLSAMNWEIKNLNTDRDTADVQVTFTAKQGGASMVMEYQMKRENNVWTVLKSGPHGGLGAPSSPATGDATASPGGTDAGALPPGHPPVNAAPSAPAKTPPAPKKSS